MDIWVYSDESGVFDKEHEKYFVFAGVLFLSDEERQNWIRKYRTAENAVKKRHGNPSNFEAKAVNISNEEKGKLIINNPTVKQSMQKIPPTPYFFSTLFIISLKSMEKPGYMLTGTESSRA